MSSRLSIRSRRRTLIALTVALACAPAPAFAQSGHLDGPADRVGVRQDLGSQIFTDAQRRLVDRYERGSSYRDALAAARHAALTQSKSRPVSVIEPGFDWGAAVAGAGAVLGLVLLTTGGVLLVRRHEHSIAAS